MSRTFCWVAPLAGAILVLLVVPSARAQQSYGVGAQGNAAGCETCPPPARPRSLGTFYETPYMTVGGNGVTGGLGYSPLQQYGDSAMALYGPFSALRATTAPVLLYQRSAGGQVRPELGIATSYPFLPPISPVKYPVRTQIRGESRSLIRYSPADAGFNWVDQN